jgi:hypothetical protein
MVRHYRNWPRRTSTPISLPILGCCRPYTGSYNTPSHCERRGLCVLRRDLVSGHHLHPSQCSQYNAANNQNAAFGIKHSQHLGRTNQSTAAYESLESRWLLEIGILRRRRNDDAADAAQDYKQQADTADRHQTSPTTRSNKLVYGNIQDLRISLDLGHGRFAVMPQRRCCRYSLGSQTISQQSRLKSSISNKLAE